ncbi:phospholipase A2 [Trichonephila clavata]|uniref:Phospholipase A2 n=1 Tax=Trichonephila clavata TaxID=2740835 RepID=A0A8X6KNE1_TRICU|nr:phospholipase A2 [Trichonephila clavata]
MGFLFPVLVLALYCCAPGFCSSSEKKLYVVPDPKYDDGRTLVIVMWNNDDDTQCKILNDEKEILEITQHYVLQTPTEEEKRRIWSECDKFSKYKKSVAGKSVNGIGDLFPEKKEGPEKNSPPTVKLSAQSYRIWDILYPVVTSTTDSLKQSASVNDPNSVKGAASTPKYENSNKLSVTAHKTFVETSAAVSMVLPGTKWCGPGDVAENFDDLGYFEDVDRCCRAHDICDDIIEAGQTKYNLTNDSPFTMLSCKCDFEFYDCLSAIDTITSNTMGNTYFNVFQKYCYGLDYPKKCKRFYPLLNDFCMEYETDFTTEMIYQWIPPKEYLKRALPPLPVSLAFLNQGT